MKKIVFLILHYMAIDDTIKCINSIEDRCDNTNYDIVVVDNNSKNDTGKILVEKYKNNKKIHIILNKENLGFSGGNNIGFRYIKENLNPDYIVMMNNDTYLIQDDFYKQIDTEYSNSKCAVIGPKVYLNDGVCNNGYELPNINQRKKEIKQLIILKTLNFFHLDKLLYKITRNSKKEVICDDRKEDVVLHGSCLIFTREYINRFDGLEQLTFLYGEEEILYLQIKEKDLLSVYNPQIMIHHSEDAGTNLSVKNWHDKQKRRYKYSYIANKIILKKQLDNRKKTFVTIFVRCEDVHLIKDVGIIPYLMHKNHGYDSKIVCYKNSINYQNLKNTPGLELEFMKKGINKYFDTIKYLIKNSKKIDVLNLYHMRPYAHIMVRLYKLLNRKGKVYLKMDAHHNEIKYSKVVYNKHVIKRTVRLSKLVTTESLESSDLFKKDGLNIEYIPNGYINYIKPNKIMKKNIILTVGRLGTKQKATDILLETFKILKDKYDTNYQLYLIGSMEEEFKKWFDRFMEDNKKISKDIHYLGKISDKEELDKYYNESKVFFLPSRYEGFPLVLPEAMAHGCYIVTSNFGYGATTLVFDDKIGKICEIDNSNMFAEAINSYEIEEDKNVDYRIQFAKDNFDWENIVKKINEFINK